MHLRDSGFPTARSFSVRTNCAHKSCCESVMKIFGLVLFLSCWSVTQATTPVGQVVGFNLVKAGPGETGAVVASLYNTTVITLPFGSIPKFSVVAVTTGGPTQSVQFDFDGSRNYRTETSAPYALCGNLGTDYTICRLLDAGKHTVTARSKGGNPFTVTFEIVISTYDPYAALQLDKRNVVQFGPRPYFLVEAMKPSPLKTKLGTVESTVFPH
jgi:hypothetical protein